MVPDGGTVYLGRDNTLDWQLLESGAPLAPARAAAITRARLALSGLSLPDGLIADSQDDPGLVAGLGTDILHWRLGHLPGLNIARGRRLAARLVVWAPDYPAGLVWANGIQVSIR